MVLYGLRFMARGLTAAPKSTGYSQIHGILPASGRSRVPMGLEVHPGAWTAPVIIARNTTKWL